MAVSPNNILGKYRILREIARSNDIVYEAIDPAMGRRVAIKELLLPPHLAGAQKRERIERFYREAKAAGTLSHPNIVTIHEVGQENDRHFIAMEFLEGQSLREILQMQGALPLKETLEIALQLCDALSYAHAHGVVHRDIKPDNAHILPGGIIKLTDFGIARITAEPSITSQGQVFGTPSYMSPEQVASQSVDHRTDLFSLGITLYEMVTGRKPFMGDSVITITYNIMNIQPVLPAGISPLLQNILQKSLAKDPNLRYQNAAAMAADLRAEKHALETSTAAGRPPAAMTFLPSSAAPATLNTGTVPPEISGLPAMAPATPSGAAPASAEASGPPPTPMSYLPGSMPQPRRRSGLSPQASSFLSLLLSIAGLVALVLLILWGIIAAMRASQRAGAERYNRAATQALNTGDYAAAVQNFQTAQQVAPRGTDESQNAKMGLSNAETAQGQHAALTGDPKAAMQSYNDALAANARNAAAYDQRAGLRASQGDTQGALMDWESAIAADAYSPAGKDASTHAAQTCLALADQSVGAGDLNTARRYWQKAIADSPGSSEAQIAQNHINSSSVPPPGNP